MTKEEHELAKNLVYLQSENPAGFMAMAALIAGTSTKKTGAALATDLQNYAPHAEQAMHLLLDYLKAEASDEVQGMIDPACAWLGRYFLDERTPAQKAADTNRRRHEAKDAEWRQKRIDRETAKAIARQVLHDDNADPAARMDAARRLEVMR